MRAVDPNCPSLLDSKDGRFTDMHCVLYAYFREFRERGVGAEMKKTSLELRKKRMPCEKKVF